jgi:membrane glycosyltransferase
VFFEPDYFPSGPSLFPSWPVWRPNWALSLLAVTGTILFVPKILSVALIAARGQARAFGGVGRLLASVVLDVALSSLLAPIRMAFHSRFVFTNLIGRTVVWRSQPRDDAETTWGDAVRAHGVDTVVATAWGGALYLLNPEYFWWVVPIVGALVLGIPISVVASGVAAGERARDLGLFLTPEESNPPVEIRDVGRYLRPATEPVPDGFVGAIVDPYANALHCALLRPARAVRRAIGAARAALVEAACRQGPHALSVRDQRLLFADPALVAELHRCVWDEEEGERAPAWELTPAIRARQTGSHRTW